MLDGTGAPAFRADVGLVGDRIAALGEIAPEQGRRVVDASRASRRPRLHRHPHALRPATSSRTRPRTAASARASRRSWPGTAAAPPPRSPGSAWPSGVEEWKRDGDRGRLDGRRVLPRARREGGALGQPRPARRARDAALERGGGRGPAAERGGARRGRARARGGARPGGLRPLDGPRVRARALHADRGDRRAGAASWRAGAGSTPRTSATRRRGSSRRWRRRSRSAAQSGARVEISHLKAAGESNWPKQGAALDLVESARRDGVAVLADAYPYTAYSTTLTTFMEGWAREGGTEAILARFRDPEARARIRREVEAQVRVDPGSWERIVVSRVKTEKNRPVAVGKSLVEIGVGVGPRPGGRLPAPAGGGGHGGFLHRPRA